MQLHCNTHPRPPHPTFTREAPAALLVSYFESWKRWTNLVFPFLYFRWKKFLEIYCGDSLNRSGVHDSRLDWLWWQEFSGPRVVETSA
jgi:hypothetical protein